MFWMMFRCWFDLGQLYRYSKATWLFWQEEALRSPNCKTWYRFYDL